MNAFQTTTALPAASRATWVGSSTPANPERSLLVLQAPAADRDLARTTPSEAHTAVVSPPPLATLDGSGSEAFT